MSTDDPIKLSKFYLIWNRDFYLELDLESFCAFFVSETDNNLRI